MRKTLVLLDCDGPLAGFVDGFLDCVEEETGERFGPRVVTEWEITDSPFFLKLAEEIGRDPKELSDAVWKRVNRIGFCSALPVELGACEAVEAIRGLDVEVEVLTSPLFTSPTWMPERAEWLARHFGFRKNQIHFVNKKQRVPGDFLVDDKPSHVGAWGESSKDAGWHGSGILWDAPYNRTSEPVGTRVEAWEQVYELIAQREKSLRTPAHYST